MLHSINQFLRRGASAASALVCMMAITLGCLPMGAQQPTKQVSMELSEQPQGKSFASPEDAAAALYAAASRNDEGGLLDIFGPGAKAMIQWTTDPTARRIRRQEFAQAYSQMHRLVMEPDGTVALYVGADNWPLPIPLVQYKGAWYFDAALGEMEILYRRIGRNEVEALEVCHALADAEKQYFASAHEYTAKFISDAGAHDGLYWNGSGAAESPIGPFLAHAGIGESGTESNVPFHGYYYRILTQQSSSAPGGARNYLENGKMTGGFAILAFPAEYGSSGIMTFLMDQNGDAFEQDLGAATDRLAKQISAYNPDSPWKKVD
jgi:hypothetical protein